MLDTGKYKVVGGIIAYSIVHGGPSPRFFSEKMYRMLVHGAESFKPTLDDVADYELKQKLIGVYLKICSARYISYI